MFDFFSEVPWIYVFAYADDNTSYAAGKNKDYFLKTLKMAGEKLCTWFEDNAIKLNADKCHLLLSSPLNSNFQLELGGETIKSSDCETLLGIEIESNLTFEK